MMNIFKGNTSEMSVFQKILGGVLIAMTSIKGISLLLNAQAAIRNTLATTYGTLTAKGYARELASSACLSKLSTQ